MARRLRASPVLLVAAMGLLALPASAGPPDLADANATRLVWLSSDGSPVWTAEVESHNYVPPGEASPLTALVWHPRLPPIALDPLSGGEPVALSDLAGKVVVLEFWASWCAPCVELLPRLQALHQSLAERGLVALAVNAREPAQVALDFARSVQLELPVLGYGREAEQAFQIGKLPSVLVADRAGRIRARWNGFQADRIAELGSLVRRLLDEGVEGEREVVGRVGVGGERVRADWTLVGAGPVEGLAVRTDPESPSILIAAERSLIVVDPSGSVRSRQQLGNVAGLLRAAGPALISFRRGGTRVVVVQPDAARSDPWEAPAPVLDAALLRNAEGRTEILLATVSGLVRADPDGSRARSVPGFGEVCAISTAGPGREGAVVALETGRELRWLDQDLQTTARVPAPAQAWTIAVDPGALEVGVGLAPPGVTAIVVGRFLEGAGRHAAVATAGGRLALLDLSSGVPTWVVQWGEVVSHLAAADLDADGYDELVVASGRRVTVLHGN